MPASVLANSFLNSICIERAIWIRCACGDAMHGFGQISHGVRAERHILDEAENPDPVLRGDVGPPFQVFFDDRSDRLVPQFALRRQRHHQPAGEVLGKPADLARQSRDMVPTFSAGHRPFVPGEILHSPSSFSSSHAAR